MMSFTVDSYKEILTRYKTLVAQLNHPEKKISTEEKTKLWAHFDVLYKEYRSQLTSYLLARCPICGGKVTEKVDVFSLNGLGWGVPKTGFGWYGTIETASTDVNRRYISARPSYESECNHTKIVSCGVNLNGILPDDVQKEVWIGSEKPFVMSPLMNLDETYAVIHTLPINRLDYLATTHPYTAYFITYFINNGGDYEKVMTPAYKDGSLVQYGWADYDLVKWVKTGKLFWLDKNNSEMPLCNSPEDKFPYKNVGGLQGLCVIREGRVHVYLDSSSQKSQKKTKQGLFYQIVAAFREGWRGE